jgi:hypothetical protein
MKRKVISILFFTISLCASAQISTCAFYDGYWGQWKRPSYSTYNLYGNYSGFIVYYQSSHPSEYIFKFQADSYSTPSKETIKYHWKNNVWYEYSGYVEYFVSDSYPSIKDALKRFSFAIISNDNFSKKRTAKATIKIAPYKKYPKVYNIWFEDVAIGIDLCNCKF